MTNLFAKNRLNRRVATLSIFTAAVSYPNMAGLSQNEFKAIRVHPLKIGLENFRATIRSRYIKSEDVNVTEIVDQLTSEASDTGKGTIHGFTRLLIGDRREGYHT